MHTCRSFSDVQRRLDSILAVRPNVRVVSFDVFDTLVQRRCAPRVVQRATAAVLARAIGADDVDGLMSARKQALVALHSQALAAGLDADALLAPWCRAWVAAVAAKNPEKDRIAEAVIEAELRHEEWACFGNAPMLRLVRNLKDRGFRLIFASDMYLGRVAVRHLLNKCGFSDLFDAGYVSGDCCMLKGTGRLYSHILSEEGLGADEVIHIGDNPHADGEMARRLGITSVVIKDRAARQRLGALDYDSKKIIEDPAWGGVMASGFAAHLPYDTPTDYEVLGRSTLAPPLACFIHGLVERAVVTGVERVFFLAREGLLLKRMYEEIGKPLFGDALPEAVYLYGSRASTLLAAMDRFGVRELALTCYGEDDGFKKILGPVVRDDALLSKIANRCGVSDLDGSRSGNA